MEETTQIPLRVENQGEVYRDRNQGVERLVAHFEGFKKEYFVSRSGKRAVLVVRHEGKILFSRQYRLLINAISCEIPGGKIEQGENPALSAVRETHEETGVLCANPRLLLSYQVGLDIFDNQTFIYFSDEVERIDPIPEECYCWLPEGECIAAIAGGRILDNMSMLAIFALQNMAVLTGDRH